MIMLCDHEFYFQIRGGGAGFPQEGGGSGPSSQPHRGDIPPLCWQKNLKYTVDFAVISAKIGHFKHSN